MSHDARKFLSDVYKWVGMAEDQDLMNSALVKNACLSGLTVRVVEALLETAETYLIMDDHLMCRAVLGTCWLTF